MLKSNLDATIQILVWVLLLFLFINQCKETRATENLTTNLTCGTQEQLYADRGEIVVDFTIFNNTSDNELSYTCTYDIQAGKPLALYWYNLSKHFKGSNTTSDGCTNTTSSNTVKVLVG